MNYYPNMNHHVPDQTQTWYQLPNFPNAPNTNRFIYVKHNFVNPNPPSIPKVLVNPHFKKKVYVNPQFNPQNVLPTTKPKIHVNPNVLKNLVNKVPKVEPKPVIETKPTTVISTRNKLVRVPCQSSDTVEKKRQNSLLRTQCQLSNTVEKKRRNSLITKYKIVRSPGAKSGVISKFKLDKRERTLNRSVVKSAKKKYVYVNRFLSMNVVAKSVLLKTSNLTKPGFVNINGILYKKSPNSLKKASDTSLNKSVKVVQKSQTSIKKRPTSAIKSQSKYKLVRRSPKAVLNSSNSRKSLVKRYKIIRSKKAPVFKGSLNKMRKCNIPCPIFRKHGKCPGKIAGTCFKLHNPDQIVLCTRFLQGACLDEKCLLSHKVSLEKMPTCKYYLEGLCSKDNCPYLHVKISPKADICRDFLEGFCKKGAECDKRHQFLCPDYEKNKKCEKRRCRYPHGNLVRKRVLNTFAKKCSAKKERTKKIVSETEVSENNRYYKDLVKDSLTKTQQSGEEQTVIKTISRGRPKLGELPAFIPFFEK